MIISVGINFDKETDEIKITHFKFIFSLYLMIINFDKETVEVKLTHSKFIYFQFVSIKND